MTVYVNSHAMHHNATIWGTDVNVFKPSRWINPSTGEIITPPKGTFLPWSGGPRVCPGMKMAQVEFVATFSTLFRGARCVALLDEGRTEEEQSERLEELMADSMLRLTLQMQNSKEVRLKWIRDGS
jgi:cytochrome P450